MADSKVCLGHSERCARVNKIKTMLDSPQETPDENLSVLIDQERSQQRGDEPEGAGGELRKQARVEGDRGGRSAQRPCRGA